MSEEKQPFDQLWPVEGTEKDNDFNPQVKNMISEGLKKWESVSIETQSKHFDEIWKVSSNRVCPYIYHPDLISEIQCRKVCNVYGIGDATDDALVEEVKKPGWLQEWFVQFNNNEECDVNWEKDALFVKNTLVNDKDLPLIEVAERLGHVRVLMSEGTDGALVAKKKDRLIYLASEVFLGQAGYDLFELCVKHSSFPKDSVWNDVKLDVFWSHAVRGSEMTRPWAELCLFVVRVIGKFYLLGGVESASRLLALLGKTSREVSQKDNCYPLCLAHNIINGNEAYKLYVKGMCRLK